MKRKIITVLLSVFIVMTSFMTNVIAEDLSVGDLIVTYSDGTGAEIYSDQEEPFFLFTVTSIDPYEAKLTFIYDGDYATNIMVPSSIKLNNKTITINELDTDAFSNRSYIESVIIPSSIEKMGNHILDSNEALTSVYVYWTAANQLPELGDNLFGDNASNITLYVPHGYKTIYQNADLWKEADTIDEFKTVNDLLSTVPGGFPSSETNCWVSDYGDTIYHADGFLTTSLGLGEPTSVTDTIPLTLDGNNYISPLMGDMFILKFVMENNVLTKIIVEVHFISVSEYSFTPLGNRKTIDSILDTAVNFPETAENGWVNINDETLKLYKGEDGWLFFNDGSNDIDFMPTFLLSSPYGSNYRFIMEEGEDEIIIDFIMNNNKLQSIQLVSVYEELEDFLGTYSVPITIDSILATNPNFPTSDDDTPPTNAWVCETGDAGWQDSENMYINTPVGFNGELPKTTLLTKDGNNYKYTNLSPEYELLFEMNSSGKLNKIKVTFNVDQETTLVYEPLGDRKSIAYVLDNYASDFPILGDNGWLNDSGSLDRLYRGEPYSRDALCFSNTGDINIPTTYLVTKSGSAYKFNFLGYVFKFSISKNKLQSIEIENVPVGYESIKGTYSPYKFTNKPISKPVGYTGSIEFVTNALYVDQSTTPVTVSVDGTPLVYGDDFEVTSGSTHVTLKGSYVSTLPKGSHTIKIGMTGYDDITSEFSITSPSSHKTNGYSAPNTGVE